MLREEAARLLMMIQGAYPNYKPLDKSVAVNTWHLALSDISFDSAQQAFITYLRSDTSGFAPAPGQLIARVQELSIPKQMNELEAWTLVENAVRNSTYNSEAAFSKLPPLIQKAVGSPGQLRAWATDEDYNSQVASSNFMRAYRSEAAQQTEYDRLPDDLKNRIAQVNASSYSAQIQHKNQEAIKIALNQEPAKIEANREVASISEQSDSKLQELKTELRSKK